MNWPWVSRQRLIKAQNGCALLQAELNSKRDSLDIACSTISRLTAKVDGTELNLQAANDNLIKVQTELTQEGKENARLQSDLSDARAQIRELKTDHLTPTIEELKKKIEIAELEGQLRVLEEQVHIRKEFGMPGERGQTLIAKVQRVAAEERAKLAAK